MVELYAAFTRTIAPPRRPTSTTTSSACSRNILTEGDDALIAAGARGAVINGRLAFQTDTEDEFTAAVERLTRRHVVAFLSANQTMPGIACELFFLDAAPLAASPTAT